MLLGSSGTNYVLSGYGVVVNLVHAHSIPMKLAYERAHIKKGTAILKVVLGANLGLMLSKIWLLIIIYVYMNAYACTTCICVHLHVYVYFQ